jgi:hypothetical protein
MFLHQNHAAGVGNGSIMVEMFLCLCLASQNLSQREFFVPARTLGVEAHHSPVISGFSGGKKKSQNKNFDDHITTI